MYIPARMWNGLLPLSLLYRMGAGLRSGLYARGICRARSAPLPVISVGNISFGGSEKTPLAAALIERFLAWGRSPALVSRGYRGLWEKSGGVLSDGRSLRAGWREAGDEPFMIARRFPKAGVIVGRDRLAGCRKAAEIGFDLVVLDDGFQHLPLARDLDIVLFHPGDKLLRREFESALNRGHVILIRRDNPESFKRALRKNHLRSRIYEYDVAPRGIYPARGGPPVDPESLVGERILAVSGIARPNRFIQSLETLDLRPAARLEFPDHHPYPPAAMEKIAERVAAHRARAILTTEKDAVKLSRLPASEGIPVFFLRIELVLPPEFDACLKEFRDTEGNEAE